MFINAFFASAQLKRLSKTLRLLVLFTSIVYFVNFYIVLCFSSLLYVVLNDFICYGALVVI